MNRQIATAMLALIVGCGEKSPTVALNGVVKLDGAPLPFASVQFVSQGNSGRDAMGTTDEQGRFELSTFEPRDGVLPGSYKVVITPGGSPVTGGAEMTADQAMEAETKQNKNPFMVNFPQIYTRPDKTPLTQSVPAEGDVVFDLKRK